MSEGEGLQLDQSLAVLLSKAESRGEAIKLAESTAGPKNVDRLDLVLDLLDLFLARLARTGVAGPPATQAFEGEGALLATLSPDAPTARRWADLAQTLSARARHGRAVNIDPAALVLDLCLKIQDRRATAQAAP